MGCGVSEQVYTPQASSGAALTLRQQRAELQADMAMQKNANERVTNLLAQLTLKPDAVGYAGYNDKGDVVVVVSSPTGGWNGKGGPIAYVGRAGGPLEKWEPVSINQNRCGGGVEIIPRATQQLRRSDAPPEVWQEVAKQVVGSDWAHNSPHLGRVVLGRPERNLPWPPTR